MDLIKRFDKVIGIDPGKSNGGIAVWGRSGVGTHKMPKTLKEFQKIMVEQKAGYTPIVFIERVQMMPKDTAQPGKHFRITKLLSNQDQMLSTLTLLDIPYVRVVPLSWQKGLNLYLKKEDKDERKKRYQRAATQYYPRAEKYPLWASDAVCLVEFGRRKLAFDPNWCLQRIEPEELNAELFG